MQLEHRVLKYLGVYKMPDLLSLAIVFFIIALVLAILGVRGAYISMEIAKWLIIVFIILAIISILLGGSIRI